MGKGNPKVNLIEKYNKNKHNTQTIRELLGMAIGRPTPEIIQRLLDEFYNTEGHTIFVASDKGKISGIIGIDDTAAPHGWILHLAVRPDLRMKGIGRNLIDKMMKTLGLKSVALETDQDTVNFYRTCGFETREIESRWPGVRRYRCIKRQQPENVLKYYDNLTLTE